MKKAVDDVTQAINEMGRSAPIVKVGETMAKGGAMVQRGYATAERKIRSLLPKDKKLKDTHLPAPKRAMGRRR